MLTNFEHRIGDMIAFFLFVWFYINEWREKKVQRSKFFSIMWQWKKSPLNKINWRWFHFNQLKFNVVSWSEHSSLSQHTLAQTIPYNILEYEFFNVWVNNKIEYTALRIWHSYRLIKWDWISDWGYGSLICLRHLKLSI